MSSRFYFWFIIFNAKSCNGQFMSWTGMPFSLFDPHSFLSLQFFHFFVRFLTSSPTGLAISLDMYPMNPFIGFGNAQERSEQAKSQYLQSSSTGHKITFPKNSCYYIPICSGKGFRGFVTWSAGKSRCEQTGRLHRLHSCINQELDRSGGRIVLSLKLKVHDEPFPALSLEGQCDALPGSTFTLW